MPTVAERVATAVAPVLDDLGLLLHDLDHSGTTIRVVIDKDGGLDVDALRTATKAISRLMDEVDPLEGAYTLEVSSPGLERPLRTPAHFVRAVGSDVTVKTVAGTEGDRRFDGNVTAADEHTVTISLTDGSTRSLRYEEIERARTTFAWGPGPKPGKSPSGKQATSR